MSNKQKITLEFDLPEGWEFTGEYEVPGDRPWFHIDSGKVLGAESHPSRFQNRRPILKRKWEWPSWLKAYAISMDADGTWYAWEELPFIYKEMDGWDNRCNVSYVELAPDLLDFTPPTVTDWKESLIINPNRKDEKE